MFSKKGYISNIFAKHVPWTVRISPTVWSISSKSSSMVVNRIAGDDSDDESGDGPRDGAVEALVDTAASDDAESIGDAAMMVGI